jgi:hypothetical protein
MELRYAVGNATVANATFNDVLVFIAIPIKWRKGNKTKDNKNLCNINVSIIIFNSQLTMVMYIIMVIWQFEPFGC